MKIEFKLGDTVSFLWESEWLEKPLCLKRGKIVEIWTRQCLNSASNLIIDVDYKIEVLYSAGFNEEVRYFHVNQSKVYKDAKHFMKTIRDSLEKSTKKDYYIEDEK